MRNCLSAALLWFGVCLTSWGEPVAALPRTERSSFGFLPDGTEVHRFTLRNRQGTVARVMTYGATITELSVVDRHGKLGRVVLGADTLEAYLKGYDHNYVLPGRGRSLRLAGRVFEASSGRVMEVRTTEPGVQLYTGNHLKHGAVCLETQHFPDSVNQPTFPSTILRPGKTLKSTTVFAFRVR